MIFLKPFGPDGRKAICIVPSNLGHVVLVFCWRKNLGCMLVQ